MASKNGKSLEVPVMTEKRRKSSEGLLDTADDLVDKLDSLMDILVDIEDQYVNDHAKDENNDPEKKVEVTSPRPNAFRRLKDGLDSTRSLIGCLRREKWRLSRRQMSVEMRMGELDEYKKHLKQDMTSMNDTVDMLSLRVIQLENTLCEQQDIQETLEMEKYELETRLNDIDEKYKDVQSDKIDLLEEVKKLRLQRCDTSLRKENSEQRLEIEVLREENHRLKEMIRLLEEGTRPQNQDGGSLTNKSVIKPPQHLNSTDLDDIDSSDPENGSTSD